MKTKLAALILMGGSLVALGGAISSDSPNEAPALELSEKMRGFLKFEMGALARAGREIEKALAEGDSATVQENAAKMDKAFIMSQDITTLDLRELEAVLGEAFVAQDKEFHAMGRALEAAAKANDLKGQRVIFDDMLHACASCHQAYAPEAPILD